MFHTIPLSPAATSKQLDPSMVLFRAAVPCQTVLGRCLSERQLTTTSAAVFEALESGKIIRSVCRISSLTKELNGRFESAQSHGFVSYRQHWKCNLDIFTLDDSNTVHKQSGLEGVFYNTEFDGGILARFGQAASEADFLKAYNGR